jgi:hypothetical protein
VVVTADAEPDEQGLARHLLAEAPLAFALPALLLGILVAGTSCRQSFRHAVGCVWDRTWLCQRLRSRSGAFALCGQSFGHRGLGKVVAIGLAHGLLLVS